MKNRLKGLLGEAVASKLNMGTFHSVAVKCGYRVVALLCYLDRS